MHRLRELRKQKKLSARELGLILGYAESTILQWERGIREPDMKTLKAIADFFDVSLDYLLERNDFNSTMRVINEYKEVNVVKIPLFDFYPQSMDEEICNKAISKIEISPLLLEKLTNPFAIICQDKVMEPTINKGDIAILDFTTNVTNNDIVLFKIKDKISLGRIHLMDNIKIFTFDEIGNSPLISDIDDDNIIAKTIEIRKKVEK
ncbi:TPA: helix-turn-helix domain-containing protein, partial [bacterium]|nr:helix-turn-helix domain-containing protein [bacterium]